MEGKQHRVFRQLRRLHPEEEEVLFGRYIEECRSTLQIREEGKLAQRFLFRSKPSEKPTVYVMDVAVRELVMLGVVLQKSESVKQFELPALKIRLVNRDDREQTLKFSSFFFNYPDFFPQVRRLTFW